MADPRWIYCYDCHAEFGVYDAEGACPRCDGRNIRPSSTTSEETEA